ncbi:MAG: galactose-1-epimerase [Photobacterium frigidiphilum]
MSNTLHQSMTQDIAFDGSPTKIFTLTNSNGMSVSFMDIGATWLSCCVDLGETTREVLLGVATMKQHQQQQAYLGATVGRYANRIESGRFVINGETHQVLTNQVGNCLHGGPDSFTHRRWLVEGLVEELVEGVVEESREQTIVFTLESPDGDQGFPGKVNASVSYTLTNKNEVVIAYSATTDKACPINLTNHAYFNLLGADSQSDCLGHSLTMNASQYLPSDESGIPVGALKEVQGTSFDFMQSKELKQDFMADHDQQLAAGYDHSFLLETECHLGHATAASVTSPDGKLRLELQTTKPAIQLYTGNYLAGCPNREGGEYVNHAGFALETQFLPDSPNHPEWQQPSCIVQPEQTYEHQTTYRFLVV